MNQRIFYSMANVVFPWPGGMCCDHFGLDYIPNSLDGHQFPWRTPIDHCRTSGRIPSCLTVLPRTFAGLLRTWVGEMDFWKCLPLCVHLNVQRFGNGKTKSAQKTSNIPLKQQVILEETCCFELVGIVIGCYRFDWLEHPVLKEYANPQVESDEFTFSPDHQNKDRDSKILKPWIAWDKSEGFPEWRYCRVE